MMHVARPNPGLWLRERGITNFNLSMPDEERPQWKSLKVRCQPDGHFYLPVRDGMIPPAKTPLLLADLIIDRWEREGSNRDALVHGWISFYDADLFPVLATSHLHLAGSPLDVQRFFDRGELDSWNDTVNHIDIYAGGGAGNNGTDTSGSGGGGGGGFARVNNVKMAYGANNLMICGAGGNGANATPGGPTYFCNGPTTANYVVYAGPGAGGTAAGVGGGGGAGSIGNVLYTGGRGGNGGVGASTAHQAGGGGGGAAGPNGNGLAGTAGNNTGATVAATGGDGGAGGAGFGGAGGVGAVGVAGTSGGRGAEYGIPENNVNSAGSGGGGGGGGYGASAGFAKAGAAGNNYAAGGGGHSSDLLTGGTNGGQGIILFIWNEPTNQYFMVM